MECLLVHRVADRGRYSQNLIFFLLKNETIKQVCYATLGCKGLPLTNTLAYYDPFVSYQEKGVL
jgi:hypothetical protein